MPPNLACRSSATVLPEVYQNEEMVLKYFYEEFQKHTKAYKSDVYSFEQFKQEYEMMQHLVYVYFVGMGAVIWQSSKVDGKLDPSQPDVIVGPVGASPEIGAPPSGSFKFPLESSASCLPTTTPRPHVVLSHALCR